MVLPLGFEPRLRPHLELRRYKRRVLTVTLRESSGRLFAADRADNFPDERFDAKRNPSF